MRKSKRSLCVIDNDEGRVHIEGTGESDTTTLCGMTCSVDPAGWEEPVTCNACRSLALNIISNLNTIRGVL